MPSKGRKKPSLQRLTRERWTPDDYDKVAGELLEGSDRASAIIGAAIAEDALVDALVSRFQKMATDDIDKLFYAETAPLQTFSAKIRIGHAMGIYGLKLRAQLDIIRTVRNAFAHSMRPLEYEYPLIKDKVARLRQIELTEMGLSNTAPILRGRFVANCVDLMIAFRRYSLLNHGLILHSLPDWEDGAPPPLLHKST